MRKLNLTTSINALPTLLDCPFCNCKKRMVLYPDPFYKGQWFHCKECRKSGDMLNLAASIWEVEEKVAAKNMVVRGIIPEYYYFDEALEIYQYRCLNARNRHNQFWENCKSSKLMFESSEIRCILRDLGIQVPTDLDSWRKGMGRLLGLSTKREAEAAIANSHGFEDKKTPAKLTGEYRSFIGKWNDVVVIPYFDLPGRIREFMFVGYDNGKLQYAHKVLNHKKNSVKTTSLAFFDQVLEDNQDEIIVTSDLLMAIRMHARYAREQRKILPVTVIADPFSTQFLKELSLYNFTLSEPKLTCDTFKALKANNVKIALDADNPIQKESLIHKYSPKAWIDKVKSSSKTYMQVLEDWLPTVNKIEAQATVGTIDFTAEEIGKIDSQQYPNIYKVICDLPNLTGRIAKIHNDEYYESEEGWFLKKTNRLISSARVRINAIMKSKSKVRLFGKIIYKDKTYDFIDSKGELEKTAAKFIARILLDNGVKCVGVDRKYNGEIYQLAMIFSETRIVDEDSIVGWSKKSNEFKLCNFSINRFGDVTISAYKMKRLTNFSTAYLNVSTDTHLSNASLYTLNKTNSSFWALAASITSAVISPAIGSSVKRFAYFGDTASVADIVCGWLGSVTKNFKRPVEKEDSWPCVFTVSARSEVRESFGSWFLSRLKPSCLVEVEEIEAYIMRLIQPWTILHLEFGNQVQPNNETAQCVVPDFLIWMLKNIGFELPPAKSLALSVLAAMRMWVKSQGVDDKIFDESEKLFEVTDSDGDAGILKCFGKICQYALENNFLTENSDPNRDRILSQQSGVVLTPNFAHIHRKRFIDIIRNEGFKMVDCLDIESALSTTWLTHPSATEQSDEYWSVSRSWWEATVQESRSVKTIRLCP